MGFFGPEHKTKAHIFELILIAGAMGLSVGRMILAELPMTRADTVALGMGGKSLFIIGYQLLSEHHRKFKRFCSRKACLVLNTLEVGFWGVVVYFSQMTTTAMCPLDMDLITSCIFAWSIIALAVAIIIMSAYAAVLSFIELRKPRQKPDDRKFQALSDEFGDGQPLQPVAFNANPHKQYTGQYVGHGRQPQVPLYAEYPVRPQRY